MRKGDLVLLVFVFINIFLISIFFKDFLRETLKKLVSQIGSTSIRRGERLYEQASKFRPGRDLSESSDWNDDSIRYKFYAAWAFELIGFNKKWGTPLKSMWWQLRSDLHRDLSWQKKLKGIERESLVQTFLMVSLIWVFAYALTQVEAKSIDRELAFIIGGMHFSSIGVMLLGTRLWGQRVVAPIQNIWRVFIKWESLLGTGLSIHEILEISEIYQIFEYKDKDFNVLQGLLKDMTQTWQKYGDGVKESLPDARKEIEFVMERKTEKLLGKLKITQFACSVLFILPSFFILISFGMSRFLFE